MFIKKIVFFFTLCSLTTAYAVNLQKFHFSNSSVFATLEDGLISDGHITTDYKYILVGSYNYVRAPFIELDDDDRARTIIDWFHSYNMGGAFRFNNKFQIGFSTFFAYTQAIAADNIDNENSKVFVSGDSTIDFKYKLWEKKRSAISVTPKLYIPTGSEEYYTSNGENGYYLGLSFDKVFSFAQIALNVGHKENNGAKFSDVDHRRQFHFSIGTLVPLFGPFDITAEFYRDTPYDSDNNQIPSEFNMGVRYQLKNDHALFVGAGTGSLEETDSTDGRVYAGFKFSPSSQKKSKKIKKEEKKFGKFYKVYDIYFKTGSSDIIGKLQREKLDIMIKRFKEDVYLSKIVIEGYASKIGSRRQNQILSEKRAKTVTNYLKEKKMDNHQIEIIGFGNTKADKNELDKSTDRKVSFRIYRSR